MKIRLKDDHTMVVDGVEKGTGPFGNYYVKGFPNYGYSNVYCRDSWEPVPEKRWRDVTKECEAFQDDLNHRREDGALYAVRSPGYRLRKVKVRCFEREDPDGESSGLWVEDAFIIERES